MNAVRLTVLQFVSLRSDLLDRLGNFLGGLAGLLGRGGAFGQQQTNPDEEALQKALDDDAPAAQIKDLLAKYKASAQAKQAKLEAAQDALKAVLTPKQEAQAYLLGLVR